VRSNDLFEVTGSPEWRNERMQVNARILEAEATNKIYHARGDSHLKLQTGSVHTNQWLYVASEDLDYSTNLAVFTDHVKARLLEDNVLRDTLNSDKLNVELSSTRSKPPSPAATSRAKRRRISSDGSKRSLVPT